MPQLGIFFKAEEVEICNFPSDTEWGVINIYDDVKYQEILGFGGAFTESSAYLYSLLSKEDKQKFLELYFSREKGIGYNFGRSHINSCDFSLSIYSSVEEGDKTLETFNLEREKKYILPFLKDALEYCNEEIVLFASPWSPPAYMKDNNNVLKGGKLLEEYKSVWAHYYAKYVKRGAVRVATTKHSKDLYTCAFINPDGGRVCVVVNTADKEMFANLRYNDTCTKNVLKPHSVATFLF